MRIKKNINKSGNCIENGGFTLIELMIVVAILGILTAVALPKFTGLRDKAKNTAILSAADTISTGMEMYFLEQGEYPPETVDSTTIDSLSSLDDVLDTVELPNVGDGKGQVPISSTSPATGDFSYTRSSSDAYEVVLTSQLNGLVVTINQDKITTNQ